MKIFKSIRSKSIVSSRNLNYFSFIWDIGYAECDTVSAILDDLCIWASEDLIDNIFTIFKFSSHSRGNRQPPVNRSYQSSKLSKIVLKIFRVVELDCRTNCIDFKPVV
jgi:hypothetical protein